MTTVYKNQVLPIEVVFKDATGTAIDISAASAKSIVLVSPAGVSTTKTGTFTNTGSDGKVRYATLYTDLTETGVWRVYGIVVIDSVALTSSQEIFVVTQAASQAARLSSPVSLAELKAHLRIGHSDEDYTISQYLESATAYVENSTGRKLVMQTVTQKADKFDDPIYLRWGPASSITSITYVDSSGTTQTLADTVYQLVDDESPAYLTLKYDQSWPSTRNSARAVTITYRAGYSEPDLCPAPLKDAILLLASHRYENREPVIVGTVTRDLQHALSALLKQYKVASHAL